MLRIAKTLSAQVQWFPSGPVGERYASLASAGFADFARPWMNSERTGSETGPKSWREQSSFILSSRAEDTASLSHCLTGFLPLVRCWKCIRLFLVSTLQNNVAFLHASLPKGQANHFVHVSSRAKLHWQQKKRIKTFGGDAYKCTMQIPHRRRRSPRAKLSRRHSWQPELRDTSSVELQRAPNANASFASYSHV